MPLFQPENAHVFNQFSLAGKVAAITGGARGIGLAAARGLAEAGASIALIYSTSTSAETIASELAKETGVTVKAYKSDVRMQATIAATVNEIAKDFGHLDIVVANAGVAAHVPALESTEAQFQGLNAVNYDGAFWTAQAAGRIFEKQGHGNLIFTASVSALLVNLPQKQAAYNASKAAVVQLAKCLAVEWVDFARVNCVSPGFVETDMLDVHPQEWRAKWLAMTPADRLCKTYELKGAYVFLASDASSYMTGQSLVIDGAYSLP